MDVVHAEIDAMRRICMTPTLTAVRVKPCLHAEAWVSQVLHFAKMVIPDIQIIEESAEDAALEGSSLGPARRCPLG